jgi:hypothetical protein
MPPEQMPCRCSCSFSAARLARQRPRQPRQAAHRGPCSACGSPSAPATDQPRQHSLPRRRRHVSRSPMALAAVPPPPHPSRLGPPPHREQRRLRQAPRQLGEARLGPRLPQHQGRPPPALLAQLAGQTQRGTPPPTAPPQERATPQPPGRQTMRPRAAGRLLGQHAWPPPSRSAHPGARAPPGRGMARRRRRGPLLVRPAASRGTAVRHLRSRQATEREAASSQGHAGLVVARAKSERSKKSHDTHEHRDVSWTQLAGPATHQSPAASMRRASARDQPSARHAA